MIRPVRLFGRYRVRWQSCSRTAQTLNRSLNETGDNAVRDTHAIGVPVGAVLGGAALVVSPSTVNEEDRQESDIEPGQAAIEQYRQSPGDGRRQLRTIVEVTRQSPPAGGKQDVRSGLAQRSGVVRPDQYRRLTPDSHPAVGPPHPLPLGVGEVVHENGAASDEEQHGGNGCAEMVR